MNLVIVDINADFIHKAKDSFKDLPADIRVGDFRDQDVDCFVSPANSFGIMDGGIDKVIRDYFGQNLEDQIQAHIVHNYMGHQPIGTAFLVETNHEQIPYLCHAPTMRTPSIISDTDNVYNAMRAALIAVHHAKVYNQAEIDILAVPGLGCGIGEMDYQTASMQMALAYKHYLMRPKLITWEYALMVEREIQQWM